MIKFNEIALDFDTRRKLQSKFPPNFWECEMSDFDSAFLCGLLRKFKPKKLLRSELPAAELLLLSCKLLKILDRNISCIR